ncbi:hypothetical protein PHISCL_07273 [Aspergillus sclerotialis]|uniref:Uncharacterized protein n=1 Tax=Aspergillus sclerotialis TaxID=2070753 RepID=A0A3A2ZG85_9EURO|nr:hypothetical protein PHISCL_07273 [Aspergillus sclerotialis]
MTNPYISWAIVLVVAGGLGYYYNGPKPKERVSAKPSAEKVDHAPTAKKQKRKVKKSPEPSVAPTTRTVESPVVESKQETEKPDEEIDNKEMAKRFAAVKSGTPLSADSGKSQKSKKKKSAAAQLEGGSSDRSASRVSTRTPSSTGADADDDLSSTGSPVVNASAPAAGYVSDMLEAPAPGASVLRVTGSMESEKKKQKPQSFKQVETKKQRQQRMKNEARKAQVQEAEEQRRKLLEKQLHSARESERREAARSKSAPTNVWQTKDNANANGIQKTQTPAQAPKVDLLDTFEPEAPSAQPDGSSKKWSQGLPSEDEQMRMLGATNGQDEWTTVSSKKIKKKGGKADDSVSEASASESQPTTAPAPAQPKITVTPTYIPDVLRSTGKGHPLDSDWAA